jgi:phage terminase Nu1 subunit (DNA packaging protein)
MDKPLSQNAIGRALGLSPASMVKMKKQGCPMDSVESAQAWREEKQSVAQRKPAEGKTFDIHLDEDYQQARTRREIAEANLAELKQAELAGVLIRVDAVRAAWATKITGARDALLQIPSRIAPVVAAETDLLKVILALEAEIYQVLSDLSSSKE